MAIPLFLKIEFAIEPLFIQVDSNLCGIAFFQTGTPIRTINRNQRQSLKTRGSIQHITKSNTEK